MSSSLLSPSFLSPLARSSDHFVCKGTREPATRAVRSARWKRRRIWHDVSPVGRSEGMDRCHGSKNDDGLIDCTYDPIFRLSLVGRRRRGAIRRQAVMRANKPASSRGCPHRLPPRPLPLSLWSLVWRSRPRNGGVRRCLCTTSSLLSCT